MTLPDLSRTETVPLVGGINSPDKYRGSFIEVSNTFPSLSLTVTSPLVTPILSCKSPPNDTLRH